MSRSAGQRAVLFFGVFALVATAALTWNVVAIPDRLLSNNPRGEFPLAEFAGVKRVVLIDLAGQKHGLEASKHRDLFSLLGQAVFESDVSPKRDTGGGIVGKVTFTLSNGKTVTLAVHTDFLCYQQRAYYLPTESVDALLALFR